MKNRLTVKNTLGMFDAYKGLVMFAMMLSHTYGLVDSLAEKYPDKIFLIIMSFLAEACMPALLIVSGYGFRKTTFKKCVKQQYKTLLIPYLVCICILPVVHLFAYYLMYGGARYSLERSFLIFLGGFLGLTSGPCWFLVTLMIGSVIFNELLQRFEGKKLLIATAVVALLGWALSFIPVQMLPFALGQALIAPFYLYLGYIAKKKKLFTSESNTKLMLILTLVSVVLFAIYKYNGLEFNMGFSQYPFGPISVCGAGVMAIVDIYLFLLLNRFTGPILNGLRNVGKISLYILIVHSIELVAIGNYAQYDFVNNWQGPVWERNVILILARFVIVFGCAYGYVWAKRYYLSHFSKTE
ncbi:MAG: acyltransferase [Butyrivibrio sp.]|nr:acyltransferase [Butyrivibrio sp.]